MKENKEPTQNKNKPSTKKPTSNKRKPKKEKHPGGRPTKFKEEYTQMMLDYFEKDKYVEIQGLDKFGQPKYYQRPNELPQFSKFARMIDVDTDTLLNWRDTNREFFGAYKKCKDIQKEFLIENGLLGLYNSTFAIFTAKNITDMRDKQEIDHTSGGKAMPVIQFTESKTIENG